MDESVKLLTVVGARPQFVKAAPVSRELSHRHGVTEVLVHTGQHHDDALSGAQFAALGLREADVNLGVHGGSSSSMIGRMLGAIDELIAFEAPDVVVVYGDTNSTGAGALAAAHRDVPVAHVEAGLRAFRPSMPEERNRVMTDHLSTILFAPTRTAVANLAREGITRGVHLVGDVMLDAFVAAPLQRELARNLLESLGIRSGAFVLATLHRAETTATVEALTSRLAFLEEVADGLPVLLPLHPRTREAATRLGVALDQVISIDPVDYRTFSALLAQSALVATDSGGVQKEAYFHRVPCVTLRSETEWPETVESGWNRLWTQTNWSSPRTTIDDYGTGRTAVDIVNILLTAFKH